jgi:hypothetical protein
VEDGNVMLDGVEGRDREVIVVGVAQLDLDASFAAYREAIEIAEAARQHAIAAALADHHRALEEIEAAYRCDLAAARSCYSQRVVGQPSGQGNWRGVMASGCGSS